MEADLMTPNDYGEILKRRKWSLILTAIIILLIAVIIAFALPSIYQSTSTILIEEQEIPQNFVMTTVTSYAEQRLQSLNQRIMSFTRLLEIIQQFNLYPELRDRWTTEEIVEKMREDTLLEPISANVIDRRTGRPTAATIAFTLSYDGKNPNTVQQVTSVLTSLFLSENLQVRAKQTEEASTFLESEMVKIKVELSDLESKIALFKNEHINELPEMLPVNVRSLNDLEYNIARVREQLRGYKEKEQYLQTQLVSVPRRVDNKEEVASQQRLDQLKVELVHLTNRFSDEYPDVIKTRAEIADLEKQLNDMGKRRVNETDAPDNPAYVNLAAQLAGIRTDINSLENQIRDFNLSANELRRRIAATPQIEEAYNALLAERNNTQAKYNDLMGKHMEARVAQGLEKEQKGERFTLIDPARLPEKPVKPNRLAIILIGLVLGIGAGIGLAALREFSDDSVRSVDQLELATKYQVLAGIPSILTAKDIAIRNRKRLAWVAGTIGVVIVGLVIFHFAIMDLDVFWARLVRRLAL